MQIDYDENYTPNFWVSSWRQIQKNKLTLIALYGIIVLILLCFWGYWLAPYAPEKLFMDYPLLPPAWFQYGNISFFFGTDDLGRDILSRLMVGTRATFGSALIISIIVAIISMLLGIFISLKKPFFSSLTQYLVETLLALPSILLAIVIVCFIGASLLHAMLAVTLSILPHFTRAIHVALNEELNKEYVVAARLEGASLRNIIWHEVLPNILSPLTTEFTRTLSIAILDIATLGFLDLGAQSVTCEWGKMLREALELIYIAPWCVMLPGICIFISVLLVNLLGDGIRQVITMEKK